MTESKVADGSITRPKLSAELQAAQTRWITKVNNGANTTSRASSPDFEVVRVAAGNYRADFKSDISACSWSATPSTDTGLPNAREVQTALDGLNNNRVFVVTRSSAGVLVESGFAVHVFC